MLSEMGNVQDHERDMRKLIQLDPDNAHAYNALGYTLADLTTRYNEALVLIQKAVELNPNDAYILDSLGWVYFKLNELAQARVYLEQAFELSGDAEIAAHLGELYWTLGEKGKAKSIWRKAQKEAPDNKVLNRTLDRLL
jgi:Flp pilus assembly protein TadD